MRSLLWKEWHEQRWKLAFMSVLLAGIAFTGLHARVIPDETVLLSIGVLAVILMPLLVGAVLIAPERDSRTLDTLLALPTRAVQILAVKTVIGVILCVVPLLLTCFIGVGMAGGRELLSSEIISLFVKCGLTILALFFWMLALTIRLPGETRATLLGLGVLIGWMIITLGLTEAHGADWSKPIWLLNPAAFIVGSFDNGVSAWLLPAAAIQAAIAGLLWFWASRQLSEQEAH